MRLYDLLLCMSENETIKYNREANRSPKCVHRILYYYTVPAIPLKLSIKPVAIPLQFLD